MRALLLAAGFGTRLRPITDSIPKCLVEINGRPLLDFWMELLGKSNITEILVNPSKAFAHPSQVVSTPDLSHDEKV